ncbi:MAG: hypothetical protein QE280_13050 [Caulobacter sp.]|nr:hypothetical protein [Caulobacter sp.]
MRSFPAVCALGALLLSVPDTALPAAPDRTALYFECRPGSPDHADVTTRVDEEVEYRPDGKRIFGFEAVELTDMAELVRFAVVRGRLEAVSAAISRASGKTPADRDDNPVFSDAFGRGLSIGLEDQSRYHPGDGPHTQITCTDF